MKTQEEKQVKKLLKPPYLSLSALERVVSLLSTRSLDEITFDYLNNQGFGKSDVYTAIVALRFLGLIDNQGKTTEAAKKLHLQGEPRTKALQEMIRSAYSKLFKTVTEPQKLSSEELHNEFIAQYGITKRIAKSAVPAFLWLCEMAGLKEKSLEPRKREVIRKKVARTIPKTGGSRAASLREGRTTKLDVIRDVLTSMSGKDQETIKVVMDGLKELLKLAEEPEKKEDEDKEKGGA